MPERFKMPPGGNYFSKVDQGEERDNHIAKEARRVLGSLMQEFSGSDSFSLGDAVDAFNTLNHKDYHEEAFITVEKLNYLVEAGALIREKGDDRRVRYVIDFNSDMVQELELAEAA